MTNGEKFKEIFGFTPNSKECVAPEAVCILNVQHCNGCPFTNFWDREYKECFELSEEFDK